MKKLLRGFFGVSSLGLALFLGGCGGHDLYFKIPNLHIDESQEIGKPEIDSSFHENCLDLSYDLKDNDKLQVNYMAHSKEGETNEDFSVILYAVFLQEKNSSHSTMTFRHRPNGSPTYEGDEQVQEVLDNQFKALKNNEGSTIKTVFVEEKYPKYSSDAKTGKLWIFPNQFRDAVNRQIKKDGNLLRVYVSQTSFKHLNLEISYEDEDQDLKVDKYTLSALKNGKIRQKLTQFLNKEFAKKKRLKGTLMNDELQKTIQEEYEKLLEVYESVQ